MFHIYIIEILISISPTTSTIKHLDILLATSFSKPDNHVICQCGCMISKYYMSEHLKTTKHEREMIGRENIKVINQYQYIPR